MVDDLLQSERISYDIFTPGSNLNILKNLAPNCRRYIKRDDDDTDIIVEVAPTEC